MGAIADVISEPAPAKINLALHILARRPDGYHDIDSLAVFANIGDRVAFAASDDGPPLIIDGPFAGDLAMIDHDDNLVLRAAHVLAQLAGRVPSGFTLHLSKNLPVGAGIGGGSADAAATLRLLNRQWQLHLPPERLEVLALDLGADVPMCLRSGALRATGKGEMLSDVVGLPPLPMVLVFPGVGVSTSMVFAGLAKAADPPLPAMPAAFGDVTDVADWLNGLRNGLERAARIEAPVIGEALKALEKSDDCLLARMSGSGSCCFGLYPSREAAERAALAIQADRAQWWVKAATAGRSLFGV